MSSMSWGEKSTRKYLSLGACCTIQDFSDKHQHIVVLTPTWLLHLDTRWLALEFCNRLLTIAEFRFQSSVHPAFVGRASVLVLTLLDQIDRVLAVEPGHGARHDVGTFLEAAERL